MIYVVGPATGNAVRDIPGIGKEQVAGDESGNGEKLAEFILGHYNTKAESDEEIGEKGTGRGGLPLMFLVGEVRRDIIPKVLGNAGIQVEEMVVYETKIREEFKDDIVVALQNTAEDSATEQGVSSTPQRWIVIFSPTGCAELLQALGLIDSSTGRCAESLEARLERRTKVATIGPTTRDYLKEAFGFEPDIVASKPSPQGVAQAIETFMLAELNA
jgi:uroporphyrinogen-III synthase